MSTIDFVRSQLVDIVVVTCTDSNHPISNILDEKESTFWITTGMFPQEFIIRFKDNKMASLKRIKITSTNVKRFILETTSKKQFVQMDTVIDTELDHKDGRLQTEIFNVNNVKSRFLKFRIESGWDQFCTMHTISLEGSEESQQIDDAEFA